MKLVDVLENKNIEEFKSHGYKGPTYDIKKVKENTLREQTWVHFGAGNNNRTFKDNK